MDITTLINHPEKMNRETLYELRSQLALYPYFQPLRLLLLQNLFLLHDTTFDEELRRAAVYITDRRNIFDLVEASHYKLRGTVNDKKDEKESAEDDTADRPARTDTLIDNFLESLPKPDEEEQKEIRKPTPADAAVDYVAYLIETEEYNKQINSSQNDGNGEQTKGKETENGSITSSLIDNFLNRDEGKITLSEDTEHKPENPTVSDNEEDNYFTETLARIYIQQGNYSKALEIIQRLNSTSSAKNIYFADQIRFLKKLIINENKKK